jgi:sterol desaturase/sphingolipid hydroxylase (fatty acid hydroxylase superfamily)
MNTSTFITTILNTILQDEYAITHFFISMLLVLIFYSLVYFIFVGFDVTAEKFHKYKFDPAYTPRFLVNKEILRTTRSVFICWCWDIFLIVFLKKNGYLPLLLLGDNKWLINREDFTWHNIGIAIAVLFWADTHFYFTHRLLHTGVLYKYVHSVHHESKNPNVFSGLSFHWFESFIYFSALIVVFFIPMPLSFYTIFKWALLIAPAGHNSFGPVQGQRRPGIWEDHWLHHKTTTYNFASGLFPYNGIWDNLLGTAYVPAQYRDNKDALLVEYKNKGE